MSRSKRRLGLIAVLALVTNGAMAACSNEKRAAPPAPEAVSVAIGTAHQTSIPDWLEAVGTVSAAQTSQVASQMMGNIVEMRAREGERVKSGQVLATVDDAQPRATVQQAAAAAAAAQKELSAAETQLGLAESTLKRYQQLYDKKSVSAQEFDEINARYQSAEARRDAARAGQDQANAALTRARTSLSYAQVRAPFAGVITERKADAGSLASPGMALFTIEDTRRFRLEATVDETDIGLVRMGQTVPVAVDALGDAGLAGRVAQIVPAADPASRSFLVKIELPADARLRSGFFGRARFSRGTRRAILIPREAVVDRGQLRAVFLLDDSSVAQLRYVTSGSASGTNVEILSGLQDGDRYVTAPGAQVLSGKKIVTRP